MNASCNLKQISTVKPHPTTKQPYENLPQTLTVLRKRRTGFAGHFWRNREELVSEFLLWRPTHGKTRLRQPCNTFIDQTDDDAECV